MPSTTHVDCHVHAREHRVHHAVGIFIPEASDVSRRHGHVHSGDLLLGRHLGVFGRRRRGQSGVCPPIKSHTAGGRAEGGKQKQDKEGAILETDKRASMMKWYVRPSYIVLVWCYSVETNCRVSWLLFREPQGRISVRDESHHLSFFWPRTRVFILPIIMCSFFSAHGAPSTQVAVSDVGSHSQNHVSKFSHVISNACHEYYSPLMMHGAAPVSAHKARVARTPPWQHSAAVRPLAVEQPMPPHCPHSNMQQMSLFWMPGMPPSHMPAKYRRAFWSSQFHSKESQSKREMLEKCGQRVCWNNIWSSLLENFCSWSHVLHKHRTHTTRKKKKGMCAFFSHDTNSLLSRAGITPSTLTTQSQHERIALKKRTSHATYPWALARAWA